VVTRDPLNRDIFTTLLIFRSGYIKRDKMRCVDTGRKNALVFSLTLLGTGKLLYVGYYFK
jgi:hypothetical protein